MSSADKFHSVDLLRAQSEQVSRIARLSVYFLHLYFLRGIGIYAGDATSFPDTMRARRLARSRCGTGTARRISCRVGAAGGSARHTDAGAASRPQAARALDAVVAGADVSCDAGDRDARRASVPVVPRAAGGQFVVGSTPPVAVGDLCGVDAPRVAPAGDAAAAPRGVLARLAARGRRRDPIQSDQHAAD